MDKIDLSKYKVEPIFNRILCQPLDLEEQTKSGIILSPDMSKKIFYSKVISHGQGEYTETGDLRAFPKHLIKPGDVILHDKFKLCQVFINGIIHYLIPLFEVLGVIKKYGDNKESNSGNSN